MMKDDNLYMKLLSRRKKLDVNKILSKQRILTGIPTKKLEPAHRYHKGDIWVCINNR